MRLGIVRGHVVLSPAVPALKGLRLVIVEPLSNKDLQSTTGSSSGKALVAVDGLGANVGQMVGFTEGREAANPFWPGQAPVDAYCGMIVKQIALSASRNLDTRSGV